MGFILNLLVDKLTDTSAKTEHKLAIIYATDTLPRNLDRNIFKIYNSVCAHRHKHINSSVSASRNATKMALMKGIR